MKTPNLVIGKITSAHGVRGEMKVLPMTDDMTRFDLVDQISVRLGKKVLEYTVENVRYHKNKVLLTLEGIKDKDQADGLRNGLIEIPRDQGVELEEDRFYIVDLIGMDVYEDGELIGKLKDVLQYGAADLYVIRENGKEWMLPATKENILSVDLENNRMDVFVPEGLREL